jgi:hypothetical protein
MNLLVTLLALISILILYLLFKKPKEKPILGNLDDFDKMINSLIESHNPEAFLIIQISNSINFIQFKYYEEEGLEIDFPLVTNHQIENKDRIIKYCDDKRLNYKITKGSDKTSEFIDIYVKSDKEEQIKFVKQIFKDIYQVNENTIFEFYLN